MLALCLLMHAFPACAQEMTRYGQLQFFPVVLDAQGPALNDDEDDDGDDEARQRAEDEAALAALDAMDAMDAMDAEQAAPEPLMSPDSPDAALDAGSDSGLVDADTEDMVLTGLVDYEQALESLQESARAFDRSQLDYYTNLGYMHQAEGRHAQAIRHFNDALQLLRVNDGLFSLAQEPLFQALTESYLALGQFEEADDMQASLFFLSQRGFQDNSESLAGAERRWADWQLHFFRDYYLYQQRPIDIDHTMNLRISRLHDRGIRSLNAFERQQLGTGVMPRNFATHSPRYLTPQSRRLNDAESLYDALVEDATGAPRLDDVERLLEIIWLRSREAILSLRRQRFMTEMHPITYQDIIQIQRMNYQQGIRVLGTALDAHADNDDTWALLSLYEADWHLLFGYPQRAQAGYSGLYQRLRQQGWDQGAIDTLFSPSPMVALPSFVRPQFHEQSMIPFDEASREERVGYDGHFDVEVDIYRDGSVRRFRSPEQSEGASGEVRSILRDYLQSSLFRPTLTAEGSMANRRSISLRYYYRSGRP